MHDKYKNNAKYTSQQLNLNEGQNLKFYMVHLILEKYKWYFISGNHRDRDIVKIGSKQNSQICEFWIAKSHENNRTFSHSEV